MATLYVVSTPIGNLSDLSPRASDVLGAVDRILAEDTRRTAVLARHAGVATPLVSYHQHNEAERTGQAVAWLEAGEDLALVSDAGTPGVSDPGRRLVSAALEAGHEVVPVPGPSAVLAALVGSGLDTGRFAFLGFAPRKGGDRESFLERIAGSRETTILFESPERLEALLGDLERVAGGDRRVAVARELTKVHESFFRGTLPDAVNYYQENPARGEVTVVVAAAPERAAPDAVDRDAVRALAGALMEQGMRSSQVAREVARRLDVPRNLAYDIVHSLTDQPGEQG